VKEFKRYDKKASDVNGNMIQSLKFKKYKGKHSLTGEKFECDVGYEAFLGPEMFFHPVGVIYLTYRNSLTLNGETLLILSLTMLFKVHQLISEGTFMKILFYLVVAL
jgi:hypothetical protein